MSRVGWLTVVLLVLAGCAKKSPESAGYSEGGYDYGGAGGGGSPYPAAPSAPSADYESDDRGGAPKKGRAESSSMAPPPPPPPPPGAPPPAIVTESPSEPVPADRMIHYDGWTQLKVANPRDTLEAVVAVAESVGGRTERLAGTTVTIRVPVLKFDEAWDQVNALGDVIDRSVRADDVTEAFTAIDLRARTLRATQARLVELLGKAKEEEEKLRLLQELTRVSEELDAIESQLRTLSDLASMSRITVEAVAREAFTAGGGRPALDGFGWIGDLSPFRRAVREDPHRVELPVPEGLVALAPRGPFVAESPDGTVLWTMRVPNDPIGGGSFWVAAVEERMADEFASPVRSRLGEWECLSVDEPGAEEPYRWQVCVMPVGKKLEIAQAWYPSPEAVARYGPGVEQALSAGGGGS